MQLESKKYLFDIKQAYNCAVCHEQSLRIHGVSGHRGAYLDAGTMRLRRF